MHAQISEILDMIGIEVHESSTLFKSSLCKSLDWKLRYELVAIYSSSSILLHRNHQLCFNENQFFPLLWVWKLIKMGFSPSSWVYSCHFDWVLQWIVWQWFFFVLWFRRPWKDFREWCYSIPVQPYKKWEPWFPKQMLSSFHCMYFCVLPRFDVSSWNPWKNSSCLNPNGSLLEMLVEIQVYWVVILLCAESTEWIPSAFQKDQRDQSGMDMQTAKWMSKWTHWSM